MTEIWYGGMTARSCIIPIIFFGTKLDSHGNWTELHTDCGNNTMDPQPLVTREISYGLAADEEALLRHCNAVQQSIDSVKGGSATLGALLLMVGLALGIFVMCRRDMNFRLQSLLGGWIAGPVAIAGYYILQDNLKTLMGNTAVAVIGAVFILCMCWYFRVVIMRFEDNEKLSNSQVTVPFLLAKVMLVFFGWSVGAEFLSHDGRERRGPRPDSPFAAATRCTGTQGLGFVFFGFKTGRQVMAWVR